MRLNLSLGTGRFSVNKMLPFPSSFVSSHPFPYTLCYIYPDPVTSLPSSAHVISSSFCILVQAPISDLNYNSSILMRHCCYPSLPVSNTELSIKTLVGLDLSSAPNPPMAPISHRGKVKGLTVTHQAHWLLCCSLDHECIPASGHKASKSFFQSWGKLFRQREQQ